MIHFIKNKFLGREEQKMKFVHIADMHFDSPFTNLVTENHMGEARRLEQRNILKK